MDDYWFCDWEPSERWPHYTRANAGEVLAPPASPLGQTFTWDNGTIIGWRDGYIRQGYFTEKEMSEYRPAVGGFFGGFFYITLANVRMQGVRNPTVTIQDLDLAFFGESKKKITHVGIMISKSEIIHAFGKIRIDKVNIEGIINSKTGKNTHKLIEFRNY